MKNQRYVYSYPDLLRVVNVLTYLGTEIPYRAPSVGAYSFSNSSDIKPEFAYYAYTPAI